MPNFTRADINNAPEGSIMDFVEDSRGHLWNSYQVINGLWMLVSRQNRWAPSHESADGVFNFGSTHCGIFVPGINIIDRLETYDVGS